MDHTERRGTSRAMAKVVIPLVVGLLVFVFLFPASGNDSQPPQCFSAFGYSVPCQAPLAVAAGVATAGVLLLRTAGRRQQ